MTRIGIIVGSTRPNRRGALVARWVFEHAQARGDAEYEVVDLAETGLPILDEPEPAAMGAYHHSHTLAWSQTVAGFDGFVFVTPEYNHSVPAALKNAIDYLFAEWHDKAAGFVGYGINGGVRAVEHLRHICAEVKMADVGSAVALAVFDDFEGAGPVEVGTLAPGDHQASGLHRMLDDVLAWSTALSPLRNAQSPAPEPPTAASRPILGGDAPQLHTAREAVEAFVAELQTGIDNHDADIYNRHFAADVAWGSPYGATINGYDDLHEIHLRLHSQGIGGPSSRYEAVHVSAPAPDVAVAHVRRVALDPDGRPMQASNATSRAFSEMALYVLIRRDGTWWLAAGQNTPIRPTP